MATFVNSYFFHLSHVTGNTFTIVGQFPHSYGWTNTDTSDSGADDLTQLGDIANDHFTGSIGNSVFGGSTANHLGFLADRIDGGGAYTYFFFTDASTYHVGDTVTFDPNTAYHLACYVTGTNIRTADGETAVEALRIGDKVMTASGGTRPIKWIGTRSYAGRFLQSNPEMLPICFKAGSIADNVPARDLWVSPNHAMYLEGVLIEARHLVNGASVYQADSVDEVTYWHIELDGHDVLIAEGAHSESFVDDDSRGMFHNVADYSRLYPDEVTGPAVYCAPRVEDGQAFATACHGLALRAGSAVDIEMSAMQRSAA